MKKIRTLLVLMLTFAVMAIPTVAFAEIFQIDQFTGDIIGSDDPTTEITRIKMGSNCIYDKNERMYEYDISNMSYDYVRVSVADGMAVTRAVTIDPGDNTNLTLYKDGDLYDPEDFSNIRGQGKYVLYAELNEGSVEVMTFMILNEYTGLLPSYTIPMGFTLSSVSIDGESISNSGSVVDMQREGEYKIIYKNKDAGVTERLEVIVDHTPPTLELNGVVNGIASGPVSLADKEEGATVSVILDGKEIGYASTLTRVGDYQVVIQDKAGNATNYSFSIKLYFDVKSWIFLAIIFVALVGTAVYILISRKNLRVR